VLPYTLFAKRQADVDEERRLLYVGMTRAQKYLVLSHARKRFMFGRAYSLGRSRFLDTIEEELLDFSQAEYTQKPKKPDNQLELF
jgi:DNA helicase-2/ATP-dependent DNA helicase PcrA